MAAPTRPQFEAAGSLPELILLIASAWDDLVAALVAKGSL